MATKTRKLAPAPQDVEVTVETAPEYGGRSGLITLNGKWYVVACLGRTTRDGYRLVNLKTEQVYDIDTSTGHPQCDCPDFERQCNTPERPYCKHGHGLVKLRKLGAI